MNISIFLKTSADFKLTQINLSKRISYPIICPIFVKIKSSMHKPYPDPDFFDKKEKLSMSANFPLYILQKNRAKLLQLFKIN